MTDNIKRLFEQMNEPTKEEAITCIMKEFNVTNRSWITNEWLMGGRIPEAFQERIVELFQSLIRKQAIEIDRKVF